MEARNTSPMSQAKRSIGAKHVADCDPCKSQVICDEQPKGAARKRQKIGLACDVCRERKVRCDGIKPLCGTCKRKRNSEFHCTYNTETREKARTKDYISRLIDRIQHLEGTSHESGSAGLPLDNTTQASSVANEPISESIHLLPKGPQWPQSATCEGIAVERPSLSPISSSMGQNPEHGAFNPHGVRVSGQARSEESAAPCVSNEVMGSYSPPPSTDIGSQSDSHMSSAPWKSPRSNPPSTEMSIHLCRTPSTIRLEKPIDVASSNSDVHGNLVKAPSESGSQINAMGTASTINGDHSASGDDFYGTSSAVSFLHQIQEQLHPKLGGKKPSGFRKIGCNTQRHFSQTSPNPLMEMSSANLEEYLLPPRALADHLLKCYWTRVHCLYPFVHKPSFLTSYQRLWAPETDISSPVSEPNVGIGSLSCLPSVFHCALNSIFALGCHFSDTPSVERQALSESFFRRSKQLLQFDILDNGDLSLVQTFLIVAQYLQSTQSPSRCWNVVGIAYRVAQGLGLYLENGNDRFSILELEMRRRAWHGCILLDKVVSMTLGRPALMSEESSVALPQAIDDEYLGTAGTTCEQPIGNFSRTTFFVEAIKLYRILGLILANVYQPWTPVASHDNKADEPPKAVSLDMIIKIDSALSEFESSVPKPLYWNSRESSDIPEVVQRQSNVLHARFLHLKILLYRPLLNETCRKGSSIACFDPNNTAEWPWTVQGQSLLQSSFVLRCSIACVEAAQELITTIDVASQTTATGAWWYNVFYLFTSAMVLILAELCPQIPGEMASLNTDGSWSKCLNALERMDSVAAEQCAKTLRTMRQQVSAAGKLQKQRKAANLNLVGQQRGTDVDGAMEASQALPRRSTTAGAENAAQASLDNDILFDDAQLKQMLWDDTGIFAPWNLSDDGWWSKHLDSPGHVRASDS